MRDAMTRLVDERRRKVLGQYQAELAATRTENERLKTDNKELQATFDLVHAANTRAIERWQAATGKELVWPDTADLCVWLMEQLEAAEKEKPDDRL